MQHGESGSGVTALNPKAARGRKLALPKKLRPNIYVDESMRNFFFLNLQLISIKYNYTQHLSGSMKDKGAELEFDRGTSILENWKMMKSKGRWGDDRGAETVTTRS